MSTVAEHPTPRRGFLGSLAAGTLALAASGLTIPPADAAPAERDSTPDGTHPKFSDAWLSAIKGKHRQFYDAVSVNEGWSLAWAMVFLDQNNAAYSLKDQELTAVVGLRHFAIPIAFNDSIWAKYKLGEFAKVNDPVTKAPATRNVFAHAAPGELMFPGMAVEKLQARGAIFTVCNVALTVLSEMLGEKVGVAKETAKQEWIDGMFPGMVIVPAGVLAVNRAQERGCTYCYAG